MGMKGLGQRVCRLVAFLIYNSKAKGMNETL